MTSPLTGPYQVGFEVPDGDPLVVGAGSPTAEVSLLSVEGMGPAVRARQAGLAFAAGVAVGVDTSDARLLKLRLEIFTPGDDEAAMDLWVTLAQVFDAVDDPTVQRRLWLWMPGDLFGHRELVGRPRGMTDDGLVSMPHGLVEVTGSWLVTTGDLGTQLDDEEEEP